MVFVCTGNRFRSVLAEAFVRRLALGLPVTTESFGTLELGDAPPLPEAVELARWCGIDVAGHTARCVSAASLADADLVLGFDASHVRQAVVDAQAGRDRTFMIRELVRLLEHAKPEERDNLVGRARGAVQQAVDLRAAGPAPGRSDEMPDPLGSPWKVYRETAAEVRELSLRLAASLFGVSDARGLPPLPRKGLRRTRPWAR